MDGSIAQLVEQYTFNVWVVGSSPAGITNTFCDSHVNDHSEYGFIGLSLANISCCEIPDIRSHSSIG